MRYLHCDIYSVMWFTLIYRAVITSSLFTTGFCYVEVQNRTHGWFHHSTIEKLSDPAPEILKNNYTVECGQGQLWNHGFHISSSSHHFFSLNTRSWQVSRDATCCWGCPASKSPWRTMVLPSAAKEWLEWSNWVVEYMVIMVTRLHLLVL